MENSKTKIITFATQKGGVGKTMTCWHVLGVLAKEGKKVLALDVDPQANLTANFGVDNNELYSNNVAYGTCQIFNSNGSNQVVEPKDIDLNSVIIKHPIPELKNVDLIPSHIYLSLADTFLAQVSFKEQILSRFMEYYSDIINQYDYILIDTAPNMFPINQNSFLSSDSIVLVSDPSIHSIDGMEVFINNWKSITKYAKKEYNIKAIILNNVDMRTKQKEQFYSYCQGKEELQEMLLDAFVPQAIALRNTELSCLPISYSKDNSDKKLEQVYIDIVNELKNKGVI